MIDSTDEWIRTRSGIIERRWAAPDETIQMMSVAAARTALERSGVEPGQIDTVIVSTVTHLHQTPAVATTIATELGATGRRGLRHLRRLRRVSATPPRWPTRSSAAARRSTC